MRSLRKSSFILGAALALVGTTACGGYGGGGGGGYGEPAPTPAPALAAQPAAPALPDAESLYDAMVVAMGGRAAMEAYTSTHVSGTFSMPAQGIEGSLDVYGAAPNKFFARIDIPGIGTVTQGYDGEVAWSNNPMVGPMLLEGTQMEQMRQQSDFYGPLNRAQYVTETETVEIIDFEGRPCYRIRVVTTWGEEYFDYIDTETGLGAGSIRNQESAMGPVEAISVTSDYRDFGGILTPTVLVQRAMGQEQVFTVADVEYDTVDESIFELPDVIRTLVGR